MQESNPEDDPFYGNLNAKKFPTICDGCNKTFRKGEVKSYFGKNLCKSCIKERQKTVNTQLQIVNVGFVFVILILIVLIASIAGPLIPSPAKVVDADYPIQELIDAQNESESSGEVVVTETPTPKPTLDINGVIHLKFPRSIGEPPTVSESAGSIETQEAALKYNNMRRTYVQALDGYRQSLYPLQINTEASSHVYSGGWGLFEKVNTDIEQRRVRVNSIGANLNSTIEEYVSMDGAIQIEYRHSDLLPLEPYN